MYKVLKIMMIVALALYAGVGEAKGKKKKRAPAPGHRWKTGDCILETSEHEEWEGRSIWKVTKVTKTGYHARFHADIHGWQTRDLVFDFKDLAKMKKISCPL